MDSVPRSKNPSPCSLAFMPLDALIFGLLLETEYSSLTFSSVAPGKESPVEVFTNSVPLFAISSTVGFFFSEVHNNVQLLCEVVLKIQINLLKGFWEVM